MARLCANENFPFLVVAELRRLGHDVVTVRETGQARRIHEVLAVHDNLSGLLVRVNRPAK